VGLLASSFPWLHHNPLLSVVVAVAFALVLGVVLDHSITVFHRWRDTVDARRAAAAARAEHERELALRPHLPADDYAPRERETTPTPGE
jgi:hypothetical protein